MGVSRQEYWSGLPLPSLFSIQIVHGNSLGATKLFCLILQCYIGEGNGTPLQCSCLENPMDGGAWEAAVHGVAKSQTRLSDFTFPFMIGEENGTPLQYSCLESLMDGGAWEAAVHGVAKSLI